MMTIIIFIVDFFGSLIVGEMSYLTRVTNKTFKGFPKEIVRPP